MDGGIEVPSWKRSDQVDKWLFQLAGSFSVFIHLPGVFGLALVSCIVGVRKDYGLFEK